MDLPPLRVLSLFAGAGGLDLGARLVGGFRTVCWVEKDRYAQGVLLSRMRDGSLDDAPLWDDVCTFDGRAWHGRVDVVCGGFPCQDLSFAGKRAGIVEGKRSGLWREYARIVGEVGPRFVLVENVPGLLVDGALGVVLGDLASLGFDSRWGVHGACAVGAPHTRERVFIVSHARRFGPGGATGLDGEAPQRVEEIEDAPGRHWWSSEPRIPRVAHGVAHGVALRRCGGNLVVPQQSVPAWALIKEIDRLDKVRR